MPISVAHDHGLETPERGCIQDFVAASLRLLTMEIAKRDVGDLASGFLGGEFGYGCLFENGEFSMHPYCWCEGDDCPWCGGCQCESEPFPPACDFCTVGPVEAGGGPGKQAPNFWHRPSGAKVWYYKYIGRGMGLVDPAGMSWVDVVSRCMGSLGEAEA
jgi:hypothetical protein